MVIMASRRLGGVGAWNQEASLIDARENRRSVTGVVGGIKRAIVVEKLSRSAAFRRAASPGMALSASASIIKRLAMPRIGPDAREKYRHRHNYHLAETKR